TFPGDIHLCPTCATKPAGRVSSKRMVLVGWAYALAVAGTLSLGMIFVAAALLAHSGKGAGALAGCFSVVAFACVIVCTGLSLGASARRLATPSLILGAAIWNGFLLAIMLFLMVVGSLMGH